MSELHLLAAKDVSRLFLSRELSPVEYLNSLISRIKQFEPNLHAFVQPDFEEALLRAHEVENEFRSGKPHLPLHGIPIGIKDVIDVNGLNTTCCSKIRLNNLATKDARVVEKLRSAGAIILGKVTTHEFAYGGPSFDLPFPPARNPWNEDFHPGGSSSGSGVGLAAGFFPLAIATDATGSIRNPAGACGVLGLKPTYDLISREGVFPLSYTLDHVGPMARSVEDLALILDVVSEHRPDSMYSYSRHLDAGIKDLRVGFVRHFHESDLPAHVEVSEALENVAKLLAELGARVFEIRLPELSEMLALARIIATCEAWAIHKLWLQERPQDYGAITRRRLMAGAFYTADTYLDAQRRRAQLTLDIQNSFRTVDVLLCANSMDLPCRIDDTVETARTHPRQARAPFNLTGHPALAIKAGRAGSGLPLSAQLIGKSFDEATLLRVGQSYECAAAPNSTYPELR